MDSDWLPLIEPEWNVNMCSYDLSEHVNDPLIEPEWNVNTDKQLEALYNSMPLNRTRMECK